MKSRLNRTRTISLNSPTGVESRYHLRHLHLSILRKKNGKLTTIFVNFSFKYKIVFDTIYSIKWSCVGAGQKAITCLLCNRTFKEKRDTNFSKALEFRKTLNMLLKFDYSTSRFSNNTNRILNPILIHSSYIGNYRTYRIVME